MGLFNSLTESTAGQIAFASIVIYLASVVLLPKTRVPQNLPWIGKGNGIFAEKKASWASLKHLQSWLKDGYQRYSSLGKSYILPGLNGTPEIILPNDKLQWLVNHPDEDVGVKEVHFDQLAGEYAFTDPYLLKTVYHEHVIHKNLVRRLSALIPHTWDEVQFQLDKFLGHDTENYKDVNVQKMCMRLIAHVSNRMFVGLPLCRNDDFLELAEGYANGVGLLTGLWAFVPKFLQPVGGPLLTGPILGINGNASKVQKHLMPVVLERLRDFDYNEGNPNTARELPEDYITWHIRQARLEGKTKELEPEMVCKFVLPVEFAAIHTTLFTLVNLLLDLTGSDPKNGYLEGIREEAERVYAECDGEWSKTALTKLVRADSAIRESMRISAFMTRTAFRKVLKPEGLKTEEGYVAPQGSLLGFDSWSRHHDPEIYPDPYTFDAFRFSKQVESSDTYLDAARLSFVATGENFLPFGHGRHACPGRFFINQELKLILAHLLMRYEVQYLPERPENSWLGQAVLPPKEAKMHVKRRKV